MNTRSRIAKFGTTLAVLMSIAALLINNPAKAARPTAVEFNFGMIGITRDQTVRLSTLNLGIEPVNLSINFADQEGRLIKRSVEKLEAGHSIFLDLTPGTIDAGAGRLQIHASVEAGSRLGGDVGRRIIPTLEVFDNETGKTQVVLCACDGSV